MKLKLPRTLQAQNLVTSLEDKARHTDFTVGEQSEAYDNFSTAIIQALMGLYSKDIEGIRAKHPELKHCGIRFSNYDLFLGATTKIVLGEARKEYFGRDYEPLLDIVLTDENILV